MPRLGRPALLSSHKRFAENTCASSIDMVLAPSPRVLLHGRRSPRALGPVVQEPKVRQRGKAARPAKSRASPCTVHAVIKGRWPKTHKAPLVGSSVQAGLDQKHPWTHKRPVENTAICAEQSAPSTFQLIRILLNAIFQMYNKG